jgi:hypothetical protein
MSGSDRTVGQGVELYTARSGPELVVEAETHRRAEATVRRHEQDPTDLLQMLGLIDAPPSGKNPESWRRRRSRVKPKQVPDAVE